MADLVVTAADVNKVSGNVAHGTAGATITQGQTVYQKSTDGEWYLAQSDGTAEESGYGVEVGIALTSAADGQPITVQISGEIDPGVAAAIGVIYCVSETAGGIAPMADITTDSYITILGVGDATNIDLSIQASGNQVQ